MKICIIILLALFFVILILLLNYPNIENMTTQSGIYKIVNQESNIIISLNSDLYNIISKTSKIENVSINQQEYTINNYNIFYNNIDYPIKLYSKIVYKKVLTREYINDRPKMTYTLVIDKENTEKEKINALNDLKKFINNYLKYYKVTEINT